MNKPGFTLVELMIATFIASIVAILLFASLSQLNRFVPALDNVTDISERAALVNAQLERDLGGVMAPEEFYARQKKQAKSKPQEAPKENAPASGKATSGTQDETQETEKEKKPLEKIFYSVNKEGMLEQLSFITDNPLQIYWGPKSGSARPRVARVLYTLKEEGPVSKKKNQKKSYSLIRQESENLEFDAMVKETNAQQFVLAQGIKSFTAEYTAVMQTQKKEQEAQKETKEAPSEPAKKDIRKSTDWLGKQAAQTDQLSTKDEQEVMPLVPQLAQFTATFWDAQQKHSFPFRFTLAMRQEIEREKKAEDVSARLMGTLREVFGQTFKPAQQPQTQLAQNKQPPLARRPAKR